MSKIDRIKEELTWLKFVFGIFVVMDVSLVAWLAQNYKDASAVLVLFGLIRVVFATAIVVWVNQRSHSMF